MSKKLLTVIFIALALSACAPSAQQLAGPVAATVAAWPTQTAFPTLTPLPTYTPLPTLEPLPTHTPVPTIAPKTIVVTVTPLPTAAKNEQDDLKENLRLGIVVLIQKGELASKVNQVAWDGDTLKVEVVSNYASQEYQMPDHFNLVQMLSLMFDTKDSKFAPIINENTTLQVTSTAKMGGYKIVSSTKKAVMDQLNEYKISQSEWQALAIQK